MKASQVVRQSVRDVLRRPRLIALEIAWRWAFGIASSLLLWAVVHFALRRIPDSDMQELRSMNTDFITTALVNILTQNGMYFLMLAIILILGLALFWTLFAGAGRACTLTLITGHPVSTFNVAMAQAFRAGVTIFCKLFFLGALFLAARLSVTEDGQLRVGLYCLLAVLDLLVATLLWMSGNWVFWLASIAAGVHQRFFGPQPSIFSTARHLARDKEHLDIEIAFGFLRTLLFVLMFLITIVPTIMLLRSGSALLSVVLSLLTLLYLAAADVLQIARVAAIVKLVTAHQDTHQISTKTTS